MGGKDTPSVCSTLPYALSRMDNRNCGPSLTRSKLRLAMVFMHPRRCREKVTLHFGVFCTTIPQPPLKHRTRPPRAQCLGAEVSLLCPSAICSVSHLSSLRFTRALYMSSVAVPCFHSSHAFTPFQVSRRKVSSQGPVLSTPTSSASPLLWCTYLVAANIYLGIQKCFEKLTGIERKSLLEI